MSFVKLTVKKTAKGSYINAINDKDEAFGLVVSKDSTSLSHEDALVAIKEQGRSCVDNIVLLTTKDGTRQFAALDLDSEELAW